MPATKLKNGQLPDTISSKTVDNTNDINTTTTRLKISGGSNGQVLSTDGSSNISWITGATNLYTQIVTKTADETVSGTMTLQDDDELFFSVDANSTYIIMFEAIISRANTTAGTIWSIQWTVPSGAVGSYYTIGSSQVLGTSSGISPNFAANTGPLFITIKAAVKTSSTSGTMQLKWGLGGGTESRTLNKGSRFLIRKL